MWLRGLHPTVTTANDIKTLAFRVIIPKASCEAAEGAGERHGMRQKVNMISFYCLLWNEAVAFVLKSGRKRKISDMNK